MADDFDSKLWELAKNNPELQKAIIKNRSTEEVGYYSIPNGDLAEALFSGESFTGDKQQDEHWKKALQTARSLSVARLDQIQRELRAALIAKEAQGERLSPQEETLRDIDINALAVFAVAHWSAAVKHKETSEA